MNELEYEVCSYNPMSCKRDCHGCRVSDKERPFKVKAKQIMNFLRMHFELYDVDILNRLCRYGCITYKQREGLVKWRKLA